MSKIASRFVQMGDVVAMALDLPEPPSANRYWRRRQGQHALYPTAEATAYKTAVYAKALSVRHRPFPKDVRVSVTLRWERGKRMGDLDNRIKVTLDALRGVLYADDKQVEEIHAYRADSPGKGHLHVTVTRLEAQ